MQGYNTVSSAYYDHFNKTSGNVYAEQDKKILDFQPFHEVLAEIQRIVPNKYLVIAGGAIRDLFMHDEKLIKDIDVFILDVKEDERTAIEKSFYGKIIGQKRHPDPSYPGAWGVIWETKYPIIKHPKQTSPYGGSISIIEKVMNAVKRENERIYPVQIIAHSARTTDELLEDFDWKACQFAFDGKTVWRSGIEDFYNSELRLGTVRNPFYTMARGFYLQEKFKRAGRKLVVGRESMLTLASMMLLDPEAK